MGISSVLKYKIIVAAFILTLTIVLWEYYNGGVITHHLLTNDDLPGFSNWWGLLTIPLLTWFVITLINRRKEKNDKANPNFKNNTSKITQRFLSGLALGILFSVLWEFGYENILQYLILTPIFVALFRPIYLPEYLLGFVIGMLYTFGGILPILIGSILLVICFFVNKLARLLTGMLFNNT